MKIYKNNISVIIPVYNTEKYLEECLDSVVNQTVPVEKIVIVNDGSTDRSLDICKRYQKMYKNIEIIDQENTGQAVARNRGLEFVKSSYVIFLDSDDYWVENTIETLLDELEKETLDILYFDTNVKNEAEVKYKNWYDRTKHMATNIMNGQEYFVRCYPQSYIVSPCMAVFCTSFLHKNAIRFPEVRAYEDECFSFKAMLNAIKVKYMPCKLYMRRYRMNSTMTKAIEYERYLVLREVYLKNWSYIFETNALLNASICSIFKIYLINSYLEAIDCLEECELINRKLIEDEKIELQLKAIQIWDKVDAINKESATFFVNKKLCQMITRVEMKNELLYEYLFMKKQSYIKDVVWKYIAYISELTSKLPLKSTDKRVGIYGTGRHTEKLMKWYRFLHGEICCELYFIDSYKKSFSYTYQGKPCINVQDINQYIDIVIISSNDYEEVMYNNAVNIWEGKEKIIRFYEVEKEDIFASYESFLAMLIRLSNVDNQVYKIIQNSFGGIKV